MALFIPQTTSAAKEVVKWNERTVNGSLYLVGDPGTTVVLLEIPLVDGPDPDNDADWTTLVIDSENQTLSSTNMAVSLPFRIPIRVNKPASTNTFGIGLK